MQAWSGFFAAIAGASASLLGLLFVAVSVNADDTIGPGRENSRRLAEQAFQNYLAVLLVALLALIPDITPRMLGLATATVMGVWTALNLVRLSHSLRNRQEAGFNRTALRRHLISLFGSGLLIFAAYEMYRGRTDDRIFFAAALIVLLSSATMVAWEFLLRVATTVGGRPAA